MSNRITNILLPNIQHPTLPWPCFPLEKISKFYFSNLPGSSNTTYWNTLWANSNGSSHGACFFHHRGDGKRLYHINRDIWSAMLDEELPCCMWERMTSLFSSLTFNALFNSASFFFTCWLKRRIAALLPRNEAYIATAAGVSGVSFIYKVRSIRLARKIGTVFHCCIGILIAAGGIVAEGGLHE